MLLYCRYVFEKILIILEETMKKTKIICTMGPNTNDRNLIKDLALAGMDIARFNFSHGDHEEQAGRFALIKSVREELNIPIATLLDTKGPEIRTGAVKDDKKVTLVEGQKYTLTTRQVPADDKINMVTYAGLPEDVTTGNIILIDDGLIELKVDKVEGTEIECTVINGGDLGSKKGVNVPNVSIRLPGITEKDKEDIIFGVEQGFDFIAASFVRNAACIQEIKEILWAHDADIPVIANHFLAASNEELGKEVIGFEDEVMTVYKNYNWPGNLREMRNVVKRATLLCLGDFISLKDIPAELAAVEPVPQIEDLALKREKNEVQLIREALAKCHNNKSEAARLLKIDRKTLYNKMKLYSIE